MKDERRDEIIRIVENELIGPDPVDYEGFRQPDGEEILYGGGVPHERYIAGVLFPVRTTEEETSEVSDVDPSELREIVEETEIDTEKPDKFKDTNEFSNAAEDLINRSNAYRPSAMSITVAVRENDNLYVNVSAGKYMPQSETNPVTGGDIKSYLRKSVSWDNNYEKVKLPNQENRIKKYPVEGEHLQFDITYRYRQEDCTVYTFTLENSLSSPGSFKDEDCYFQVEFCLKSDKGFAALPGAQLLHTQDEDYLSNQLLYRDKKNYAIGHGCAADWDDSGENVLWIKTSTFPVYEVKPIVPSFIEGVNLEMKQYGPDGDLHDMVRELRLMCDNYRAWISQKKEEAGTLNSRYSRTDFQETAERHIKNCEKCLDRMEEGISLLENDRDVQTAFQYMNLVMLMQQLHYNLPLQKWETNEDDNFFLQNAVEVLPDPDDSGTWYNNHGQYGRWRPFQMAFILMNLKSMREPECEDRKVVDLIWFPTGGGKTEAYLGLTAYTIFLRRLLNQDDSGTAVLMRYTLRLLTAQQYERAASLICACEVQRQNHQDLFGTSRITIGLWVGKDTTPNKMSDAVNTYHDLYSGESEDNPFVLLKCPWCGAQMGVVQKKSGIRDIKGYKKVSLKNRKKKIVFSCSNPACDFSDSENPLPLLVVDEAIYESPPSLLLGTVDKFAMLPFLPEAQKIFGYENGVKVTSPDLIIQDELHLISGPLGSMVGHYETMVNELCTSKTKEGRSVSPKIVASTATISRAREQCHALYGCKRDDVFQFPPAGISAEDSFFAHEDKEQNGRKYVGILALGSSSDDTTAIRLYATLLFAAKELNVEDEADRDPYWTNMGYFNSLRELGQARSWIRADIDQQLDNIYKRKFYDKIYDGEKYKKHRRYIWRDEELTSRITGDKVTASLANLDIQYCGQQYSDLSSEELPIDICLATNMISVGLDVQRLGLMTVSGQPKTTSEYIQATSRVGRNGSEGPGLVFVLYRPGRPRDKSHYEHFKDYHSRLYCNVEPTSVTPFSPPVRERALHAIMIGIMRLENDKDYNNARPEIPNDDRLNHIQQLIRDRVFNIDTQETDETMQLFEKRLEEWQAWNPELWSPKRNRDFSFTDDVPLMYGAGDHPNEAWAGHGFETPQSMRSVDASCEAEILHRKYTVKED